MLTAASYKHRLATRTCIQCRVPVDNHTQKCSACNKKQYSCDKTRRDIRKAAGVCVRCGNHSVENGFTSCDQCRIKSRKILKVINQNNKLAAFNAYGGCRCACCGETNPKFLTIDHVFGGGNKHRKTNNIGNFYNWLKGQNYPEGYQVLCYNCNCARGHNGGVCPHVEQRVSALQGVS